MPISTPRHLGPRDRYIGWDEQARVDREQHEAQDWPVVGALVSKLISGAEARQARMKAKANQKAAAQQAMQTERLYNRTGGSGGDRQKRVAARHLVGIARKKRGWRPRCARSGGGLPRWITKKIRDIEASAVGMGLAPMPGGWRECA
jgi:hypothetical protein